MYLIYLFTCYCIFQSVIWWLYRRYSKNQLDQKNLVVGATVLHLFCVMCDLLHVFQLYKIFPFLYIWLLLFCVWNPFKLRALRHDMFLLSSLFWLKDVILTYPRKNNQFPLLWSFTVCTLCDPCALGITLYCMGKYSVKTDNTSPPTHPNLHPIHAAVSTLTVWPKWVHIFWLYVDIIPFSVAEQLPCGMQVSWGCWKLH